MSSGSKIGGSDQRDKLDQGIDPRAGLDAFYFSQPNTEQIPLSTLERISGPLGFRAKSQVRALQTFRRDTESLAEKAYAQLEATDIKSLEQLVSKLTGIKTKIVRNDDRALEKFFGQTPTSHDDSLDRAPVLCAIHKHRNEELLYVRESLFGSDNRNFSYGIVARHLAHVMALRSVDKYLSSPISGIPIKIGVALLYPAVRSFGWPLESNSRDFLAGMVEKYFYRLRYRLRLSSTALVPFAPKERIIRRINDKFYRSNLGKSLRNSRKKQHPTKSKQEQLAIDLQDNKYRIPELGYVSHTYDRIVGLSEVDSNLNGPKQTNSDGRTERARLASRIQAGLEGALPTLARIIYKPDRSKLNFSGVERPVFATKAALQLAETGASPALICAALIHQAPTAKKSAIIGELKARDMLFGDLVERFLHAYDRLIRQFPTSPAMPVLIPTDADPNKLYLDDSLRNKSARYLQLLVKIANSEQQERARWFEKNGIKPPKYTLRIDAPDLLRLHQACILESVRVATNKASIEFLHNLQRGITRTFAPFAARLQQTLFNRELRNAYFRATHPEEYARVVRALRGPNGFNMSYVETEKLLDRISSGLRQRLAQMGVPYRAIEIQSRAKDPESVWRKWKDEGADQKFEAWLKGRKDLLGVMLIINDETLFRQTEAISDSGTKRQMSFYHRINLELNKYVADIVGAPLSAVHGGKKRVDYLGDVESAAWHHLRIPHPEYRTDSNAALPLEIQLRSRSHLVQKHLVGGKGARALAHDDMKLVRATVIDLQETFGLSEKEARRLPQQVFDHFDYRDTLRERVSGIAEVLRDVVNVEVLAGTLKPGTEAKQRSDFEREQFFRTVRLNAKGTALDLIVARGLDPRTHEVCECELDISARDGFTRKIRDWRKVYWRESLDVEKIYVIREIGSSDSPLRFDNAQDACNAKRTLLLKGRKLGSTAHSLGRVSEDTLDIKNAIDEWGYYDFKEAFSAWRTGLIRYAQEFENLDQEEKAMALSTALDQGSRLDGLLQFNQQLIDRFTFHNGLATQDELFEALGRGIILARELREQYEEHYVKFKAVHRPHQEQDLQYLDVVTISENENQRGILADVIAEAEDCGLEIRSATMHGENDDIQLVLVPKTLEVLGVTNFVNRVPNIKRERGHNIPDPAGIVSKCRLEFDSSMTSLSKVCRVISAAKMDIVDLNASSLPSDGENFRYSVELELKGPAAELDEDLQSKMNSAVLECLNGFAALREESDASSDRSMLVSFGGPNYELEPGNVMLSKALASNYIE